MFKLIFKVVKILLILTLPFLALIGGATFIHGAYNPRVVASLIGGVGLAVVVLIIYMSVT